MKALIVAVALVAAGVTPVLAQESDVPTAKVSYRDINFDNPASVRNFYARLRLAAHRVCDYQDRSLAAFQRSRACERHALDRAVAQVGRPELYALHGAPVTEVAQAQ